MRAGNGESLEIRRQEGEDACGGGYVRTLNLQTLLISSSGASPRVSDSQTQTSRPDMATMASRLRDVRGRGSGDIRRVPGFIIASRKFSA
jgi:hypothetical protein